jgi:hypothetical protein
MRKFKEILLRLFKAPFHGFNWIHWEIRVSDNHLMKLISQKVSTLGTSMSIIDGKEGASWPEVYLLELWLNDIQNDRNSVFVVISNHTLVSISRVCDNDSILF